MKKIITLLLMSFSLISHGQLSGLKNKIKKTGTDQTDQKATTSNPFENKNQTDEEKENIEISKSPAASNIHGLRKTTRSLRSGIDAMKDSYCHNCNANVKVGDRQLEQIKAYDPDYIKLAELEKEFATEKIRYDNIFDGYKILEVLGKKSDALDLFLKREPKKYFDFFRGHPVGFKDSLFSQGENHTWDTSQVEIYAAQVSKINAFFDENTMKFVDVAVPELKPNYDKAEYWTAANRATAEFEEEVKSWSDIKSALTAIGIAKNDCEAALSFAPDHIEMKKQYALVKTRYEDLQTFVESGEYEKLLARKKVEEIDAVRMSKPGNTSSSYVSLASKNAQAELKVGAKVLKTVITSSDWTVQKNNLDLPINKIMYYQIAYKDTDGTCRLGKGTIVKTYEGGGKYGPAHANYAGRAGIHDGAINCNNVTR
jgi:hypothetical protein